MIGPPAPSPGPDPTRHSRLVTASPIYYGWVALMAATVGLAMTIPGQTVGVSVFLDRVLDDLDLSRSAASSAYAAATLLGALALPTVGRLVDRHGPRRSVVVIAAAFAVACITMSLARGLITLLLGFTLIRALGQGALGLVSVHEVNIWFVRRRGLAVGIAGAGFAVATALAPAGINALIEPFGWRMAYFLLGMIVLLLMVPVGGGLFRDHPENYGIAADPPGRGDRRSAEPVERHYRPEEARRTLTFWLYVAGGFLTGALGTGLVFHHYSIMAQSGVPRSTASVMFIAFGFVIAGSGLVTGFLIDRIPPRFLLSGSLGLMGITMLAATRISTAAAVVAYGTGLGVMQGMSQSLQAGVYAHYFGRLHIGAIRGLAGAVNIAGSALGPLLLAVAFDSSGTYTPVLVITAFLPLSVAAVVPFLRLKRNGHIR